MKNLLTLGLLFWGGISSAQNTPHELPFNKAKGLKGHDFHSPKPTKNNGTDDFTAKSIKARLDSVVYVENYDGDIIHQVLEYKYDLDNKALERIFTTEENNQFMGGLKEVYSYNSSNLISEQIKYYTNENLIGWKSTPEDKSVFEYDSNGNLLIEYAYYWDTTLNQLKPTWKFEYSSIGLNSVILKSFYQSGTYVLQKKNEISYNSDMKEVLNIRSGFGTGAWIISDKKETTYDIQGNIKDEIRYWMDQSTNTWTLSGGHKNTNTYNGDGEIVEWIGAYLNTSTSLWENDQKAIFVFDNNYTFSNLILPIFSEGFYSFNVNLEPHQFHHKLDQAKGFEWDDATNNWSTDFSTTNYFYSTQTLGTENILENASISMYPNPAQSQLTISAKDDQLLSLQITDLNGKMLLEQGVFGNAADVEVGSLSAGVYLLKITTEKGTAVKRFVKE